MLRATLDAYKPVEGQPDQPSQASLSRYSRVADRCLSDDPRRHFRDVQDLKMALSGDSNRRLYLTIITFLAIMALILGWLCWKAPAL